jgi:hypothetical protein
VEAREQPPSPEYRPLERRAWLAARWIGFTGALALGLAGLDIAYLSALGRSDDASGIGTLIDLGYIVQLAVHVLGAAIFLAWFYRAYSNVRTLGVPFLRHDRGWAIAAWFVPILSLVWPKRMANDAWRASDPELARNDADWLKRPVAPLVHLWWAAWLVANFADNAWARMNPTTTDGLRSATVLALVGDVAYVVAAVLCILFIRRLTAREEAKAVAEVASLELSEDQRAAAEQKARHGYEGTGRRIAWYAAGAVIAIAALAVAIGGDDEMSSVGIGRAGGAVLVSLIAGVAVVQLVGRLARRRPATWSGWAGLVAVIVMLAAASVLYEPDSGTVAGSPALDASDTTPAAACPDERFRPGRLPPGYRYSQLTRRERRQMLADMRLPKTLERQTVLVYVNRRGRTAALVKAIPNAGEPDAFLEEVIAGARQSHPRRVKTKPMGAGTLVDTPEIVMGIVGKPCTSVLVMSATQAVVRRLTDPVAGA